MAIKLSAIPNEEKTGEVGKVVPTITASVWRWLKQGYLRQMLATAGERNLMPISRRD